MDIAGFTDWKEPFLAVTMMTVRPITLFAVTPFLNTSSVTGGVRSGVILSLMLFMAPLLFPELAYHDYAHGEVFLIAAKEGFIGFLMGFLVSLPLWIAEAVGFMIDNQRGTTMASLFNPLIGGNSSPLGVFMNITATALFFQTGAFVVFLSVFYGSYLVWPVLAYLPSLPPNFPIFFLDTLDHFERSMILYSAPMVIVMFMTDFGLGLVNRFAPQLNVFFMSMPIKSVLSLIILILYMAYFLSFIEEEFLDSFEVIKFIHHMLPVSPDPHASL